VSPYNRKAPLGGALDNFTRLQGGNSIGNLTRIFPGKQSVVYLAPDFFRERAPGRPIISFCVFPDALLGWSIITRDLGQGKLTSYPFLPDLDPYFIVVLLAHCLISKSFQCSS
jgi:hypothetical protein